MGHEGTWGVGAVAGIAGILDPIRFKGDTGHVGQYGADGWDIYGPRGKEAAIYWFETCSIFLVDWYRFSREVCTIVSKHEGFGEGKRKSMEFLVAKNEKFFHVNIRI